MERGRYNLDSLTSQTRVLQSVVEGVRSNPLRSRWGCRDAAEAVTKAFAARYFAARTVTTDQVNAFRELLPDQTEGHVVTPPLSSF